MSAIFATIWAQYGQAIMGAAAGLAPSIAAAILPQAAPGTPWALVRGIIDTLAVNMGNSANKPKV